MFQVKLTCSLLCIFFINISFGQKLDLNTIFKEDFYSQSDLEEYLITDDYTSNGIRHIYLRQAIGNIELFNANAAIHLKEEKLISSNIQFIKGLHKYEVQSRSSLDPQSAVRAIINQKKYKSGDIHLIGKENNHWVYKAESASNEDIKVRQVYYLDEDKIIKLGYQLAFDETEGPYYIDFIINAESGIIWKEINWTVSCKHDEGHICIHPEKNKKEHIDFGSRNKSNLIANSYNVFPWPMEDPFDGDRVLEVNPELDNTVASPEGWHTSGSNSWTTTRGNNTDTYEDTNDSDGPTGGDAARVDGGNNLEFDFPLDTSGNPLTYQDAAITNLFYWNNVLHDVWFNYGFDEVSGNFQRTNYTGLGQGNDYVQAEALHPGQCNAFFSSPSDGNRGRMEMYVCGARDGDYDNLVIAHEFGHGISIRLTGGPGTSGCLGNQEQMGEGGSDWFGVVMTIQPGETGATPRPVGNYLFENGPNGGGIRPFPYSTDMSVNPMTYASSFSGVSRPHGIGSVWATMLHDMTWKLIDVYGFDPDIYNGTGGNNIAMALVIEGLKQQPCSPGFVDGRDGILAADVALYGGANQCLIWEAFANRGLGFSADQGSSNDRADGTEAFDMPPSCKITIEKTVDLTQASPGDTLTYTITAKNVSGSTQNDLTISDELPQNTIFVSADNGGTQSGNTVNWSSISLNDGDSIIVELVVSIDPALDPEIDDFFDDMESGSSNFTNQSSGSTNWVYQNTGANSGNFVWFANDGSSPGEGNLTISLPLGLDANSTLTFNHRYDTEATWDGGLVLLSTDNGDSWVDLGPFMTSNGYNSTIFQAFPGFSGDSQGYLTTSVDLSSFEGQNVLIRFQMICDQFVGGNGWFIDDVNIKELTVIIPNMVSISNSSISSEGSLLTPTKVIPVLTLAMDGVNADCGQNNGTAIALATGGSDIQYSWNTGATLSELRNIPAGIYVVTVSQGGRTMIDSIEIFEGGPKIVTETQDLIEGSLRDIVANVCSGDTVYFDASLNNASVLSDQGEIIIDKDLVIIGLGIDNLTIDAGGNNRIFNIQVGATVSLENLHFSNANTDPDGGAILNQGTLSLKNVKFSNNFNGSNPRSITNKSGGTMNIVENVIMEE